MTRTTLTLDEDVANRVKDEMRNSGGSLKETVNALLRLGLDAKKAPTSPPRFEVEARHLNAQPGVSLDNIGEVLDQLDVLDQSRYRDSRYR